MIEQAAADVRVGSETPAPAPASLGLAIVGSDMAIRFANRFFLSSTGVNAEEAVGKPLTAFLDQASGSACARGLQQALASGNEFTAPVRWLGAGGRASPAELSIVPVFAGGTLLHFVAVLRELADLDDVEAQLDASNRRFYDLLEHLPAGVVVHGSDSRVIALNRLAATLLGMDRRALVGKDAVAGGWHFLRGDGRKMAPHEYPVCRALSERRNLSNIIVGICVNDHAEPVWVICNTYLVCDELGGISEVVVCFTDCTELKRTEQSLHKSEERLRLVLQGSTDASWDWDLRSGEVYYSDRWWEMVGRSRGELPETAEEWLNQAHPDDVARVREVFDRALASTVQSYEVEFRLRHKDGHDVPVLSRGFILRDQHGRPLRVSGTNTDLTERKQAEHYIHQLAYFDFLTGLPNRRFLTDELHRLLGRCARAREIGALLFLDLDNFKVLNDTLGHETGDLLLRQVAHRLRHAVRESDCVARLGGDEFVVLLANLGRDEPAAADEADHVGRKLLAVCDQPYALPARAYRSTPSIGVTLFDGGESADMVLRQADLAMYQAKAAGRNAVRFFDPQMQAAIEHRYAMEHDLREGLQRHELRLYCQPQFDAAGKLSGGEVLLRWQRGDGALVAPGDFIGLAEATGLVLPIGRWVLRETCRRLASWRANPRLAGVPLAVNVSAQQLHCADFPEQVLRAVRDSGADPRLLGLELTESVLAENLEDVIAKMHTLERDGIRFSIDDFGTGYSSLSYLKRFPLETLKIDRSFVHDIPTDPHAAAIVEVIITLARKLGLQVVAEGVEQEAQRQFLQAEGCDRFQGYLLGHPVDIDEFEHVFGG
jgi:diguanylate cyclase (GGDEF)-like protein/PAS domain S-box-containing protein